MNNKYYERHYAAVAGPCRVCEHEDGALIDMLLAAGVFYLDIGREFLLAVSELRRHEALHSTKQPSIDPVTILLHLKWLNEEAAKQAHREIYSSKGNLVSQERFDRRQKSLQTSLNVARAYADTINVKKHIDQYVSLPRWQQVMQKIAKRLKDIPGALEALGEAISENSPKENRLRAQRKQARLVREAETDQEVEELEKLVERADPQPPPPIQE
jgi:hypothetical protein